ncbi:rhamnulokinase family protein [Nocardiopsis sp. NRRL B-16309]|uniref:rhamnulokinase n=1 Tax=Nocardiopsis sp. NRRL B-16309 TaxID=1519494 RepID=UPI0006ADD9BD|nr:rhamnulokinase family protein [Nocardiopsis sp. NRRL B-16309]KOX15622.1 carbohydrate kinase [Nocardiopsis sp. NRRL B-16309]
MSGAHSLHAAVDLGASSGRVITGRLEEGRLHTEEVARFPNGPVAVPRRGRETLHWDILSLYRGVLEGLRAAAGPHGGLASVGIDSWAVDYGLLDGDAALLGNPVHYRDARTAGAPERVFEHLPADRMYAVNGLQVQPFNTLFQLAAAAGDAQLAPARDLMLIPDLLGYWLTGERVAELTNASTTGMVDVRTRTWADACLDVLEGPFGTPVRGLLSRLVEPGTVVGPLRGESVGAAAGAPLVAVGSHDTASAVVAVPAATPNFAYVSCGTWSLVGVELDAPVRTERSRAANFTNELGVDGTVRYLRNVMGLWVLQESLRTWRERGREVDLADLLRRAADVPALSCVVDVDDPRLLPPGDMPGRIAELAAETGQRPPSDDAELARCVIDSLALAYRRAVRQAAELSGRDVDVVHVVGGGAHNTLLCRLTADATGLPVVAGPTEGAAIGNLLVQARAVGAVEGDLAALRRIVAASTGTRRYEPSGDTRPWEAAHQRLWS